MKQVARNRRARFDYEITETVEAGIVLTGPEVKSCRNGGVSLAGAYVSFLGGKPLLKHASIAAYRFASAGASPLPGRDRELLMKKSELARLQAANDQKGMTLIPLEIRAGKYIKVLLGVARGRKQYDKRAAIRKRETDRKLREGSEI